MKNKKALGQNWLKDRATLDAIVEFARLGSDDTVLEIGPGLGTLTSALLRRVKKVVAVEVDERLAANLPAQFPGKNLQVVNSNILQFDLTSLPTNYKVVANLPYYITSRIIMFLLESEHKPKTITILVQKEVAERLAQIDGSSVLALAVENWAEVRLGQIVPAEMFVPVPQVDSQVVKLILRSQPLLSDDRDFMWLVKAGFVQRRKKLKSSLSAGLGLSREEVEEKLAEVGVSADLRAQDLSFNDWRKVVEGLQPKKKA